MLDKEFANQVTPNIWLGDFRGALNRKFLEDNKITYIINAMEEDNQYHYMPDIPYVHLPYRQKHMNDYIGNHFLNFGANILNELMKNNNVVYVHCKKGHHRSASVICAYLIKFEKFNNEDAISFIKDSRDRAFYRDTFLLSLIKKYNGKSDYDNQFLNIKLIN